MPIGDVAKFLKSLIPANIPKEYALKPVFESVASDEKIRDGVIAFRDFLYLLFDRLVAEGSLYAKPPNKPGSMTDYPFLHRLTNLLVEIGYHGKLTDGGDSLLVTDIPLSNSFIDEKGKKKSPKISASGLVEVLRFLSLCGFVFTDTDLEDKKIAVSDSQPLKATYPRNPALLTGLKALSIADMELRAERRYWNDCYLLRCDYRLLRADSSDIFDELEDFLRPLPEEVQEFAKTLHKRYTEKGLTCFAMMRVDNNYFYVKVAGGKKELSLQDKYQKRLFAFSNTVRFGYSLFVRSKKTEKYKDTIAAFAPSLQKKIAIGYGCYRQLGRTRCTGDCQGIRLPLDKTILDISDDIIKWLDCEV